MSGDLGDIIGTALIGRKIRNAIEKGNEIQREQLKALNEIKEILKARGK